MKIRITPPDNIRATIQLPASKSISNRALIINALGNGEDQPENLSDCDDTQVMIRALQAKAGETIDIMAAGTAMGGKKIIKSVGMDMVKLEKYQGFSADIAAAISLFCKIHF